MALTRGWEGQHDPPVDARPVKVGWHNHDSTDEADRRRGHPSGNQAAVGPLHAIGAEAAVLANHTLSFDSDTIRMLRSVSNAVGSGARSSRRLNFILRACVNVLDQFKANVSADADLRLLLQGTPGLQCAPFRMCV